MGFDTPTTTEALSLNCDDAMLTQAVLSEALATTHSRIEQSVANRRYYRVESLAGRAAHLEALIERISRIHPCLPGAVRAA